MTENIPYSFVKIYHADTPFDPGRIQPISVYDPHHTTGTNVIHIDCVYIPRFGTFLLSHKHTHPDVIHARSIHDVRQAIDTICPGAEYSLSFILTYHTPQDNLWVNDGLHLYYSSIERHITKQFYEQEQRHTTQTPGTCWIRYPTHTHPIHDIHTPILDIVCLHHQILSTYYTNIDIPNHIILADNNMWSDLPTPRHHTIREKVHLFPKKYQGQAIITIKVYSIAFVFRNAHEEESLMGFIDRIYRTITSMSCPAGYSQHEHMTTLRILGSHAQQIEHDILALIEEARPIFQQYYHHAPGITY